MNSTEKQQFAPLRAFSAVAQGALHKRRGKVCQDAAYARCKRGDRYAVAIVSDGHGSDNYFRSDRGSRFAVEAAREAIGDFMKNFKPSAIDQGLYPRLFRKPDDFMRQLETHLVYLWKEKVAKDYRSESFTAEELAQMSADARKKYEAAPDNQYVKAYGATLIAVMVCPGYFWFGLHIGDGKCVMQRQDGTFCQPIPWDERCFLNVTTSLCDPTPVDNFRHCFHFHAGSFPAAIFVGSDGIDDSFANDEKLYGFYREVIDTFQKKDLADAKKEMEDFLPVLSEKGSGDDVSVSGILVG